MCRRQASRRAKAHLRDVSVQRAQLIPQLLQLLRLLMPASAPRVRFLRLTLPGTGRRARTAARRVGGVEKEAPGAAPGVVQKLQQQRQVALGLLLLQRLLARPQRLQPPASGSPPAQQPNTLLQPDEQTANRARWLVWGL